LKRTNHIWEDNVLERIRNSLARQTIKNKFINNQFYKKIMNGLDYYKLKARLTVRKSRKNKGRVNK